MSRLARPLHPLALSVAIAFAAVPLLTVQTSFAEESRAMRGFQIPAGTRVLVVEDIVTTGGSVKEVMEVVKEHGGELVGVGLLVDRSGGKVDFGVRTEALLHLNVETFDPATCPLCAKGVPFTKRGRTGK